MQTSGIPSNRAAAIARSGRSTKRFLFASTLSLVLHAGVAQVGGLDVIGGIISPFYSKITESKKIENTSSSEKSNPIQSQKGKSLDDLKLEKSDFMNKLLSDLNAGRPIDMLEFFVKRDVLDRNISALGSGNGEFVEEEDVRAKILRFVGYVDDKTKMIVDPDAIVHKIHQLVFRRLFRAYSIESYDTVSILNEGYYKCDTGTQLMAIFMQRKIPSNNTGVILLDADPKNNINYGHVLSWYQSGVSLWQIENMEGQSSLYKKTFQKGLRVPNDIFVSAYLLNNGMEPDQLPKRFKEYYKLGVAGGGLPVAGVVHNNPDPPADPIINPLYEREDIDVINRARIMAMAFDLFRDQWRSNDDGIPVTLLKIPAGVDWCAELKKSRDGKEDAISYEHNVFEVRLKFLRYRLIALITEYLSKTRPEIQLACSPQDEQKIYRAAIEKIILEGKPDRKVFRKMIGAMIDEAGEREKILEAYKINGSRRQDDNLEYFYLSRIGDPKDYELFKEQLSGRRNDFNEYDSEDDIQNKMFKRTYAAYYLGIVPNERKDEAAALLKSALFSNGDKISGQNRQRYDLIRGMAMYSLAKLGRASEVIQYLKNALGNPNDVNINIKTNIDQILEGVIENISEGKLTEEDMENIRGSINKEEAINNKTFWIALLARAGKIDEAIDLVNKGIIPRLLSKEAPGVNKADALDMARKSVLGIGKIRSPKIKEILMNLLKGRSDLAVEIGNVFYQNGFYAEEVIGAIKKILNNESENSERREYAAYVLVRFGKL